MTPGELLKLAKDSSRESRSALFGQITDLFLAADERLSDLERAHMDAILRQLVGDVERQVRATLADTLGKLPNAPSELVELLANDEAQIAVPLLLSSDVIRDPTLIEIVRDRTREHAIAIASRRGLSGEVSEAVVERGVSEQDVGLLETLVRNGDAALSRRASEYLVEEAKRFSALQDPLVDRADLPADLCVRLYWSVAAGLKRRLLQRFVLDEVDLHVALEDAVVDARRSDLTRTSIQDAARRLVDQADNRLVSPRAIIGHVRSDRMALAYAALSRAVRLHEDVARRTILEGPKEALAVLAKAAGFGRDEFVSFIGVCGRNWPGYGRAVPVSRVVEATRFFDELTDNHVKKVLAFWRSDPDFRRAEEQLNAGEP